MATDPRKSDFISEARQETRKFWSAYLKLLSFQNEWNAQSYSTTMDTEDFTNENAGPHGGGKLDHFLGVISLVE